MTPTNHKRVVIEPLTRVEVDTARSRSSSTTKEESSRPGCTSSSPAELLSSNRMRQILDQLTRHVDIVVFDTPPSMVADAQILAARVDAVLFVLQPGVTKANMAMAALESYKRSGARIVGVVMNRIPKNRGYYYGGYKYYSSMAGRILIIL